MKHINYFREFLSNEVNLNPTRLRRLKDHFDAVKRYLSERLGAYEETKRQGSFGLQTIIKPVGDREYDADALVFMTYDDDKEPKAYINDVYQCLRGNKNYADKVHRRTRCVYIDYAGDFHLDLVPCTTRWNCETQQEELVICNNTDNDFEVTDGTGYRDWFNEKTKITDGNLRQVTLLLKFLRDHKGNFSVKSILLTTLIGNHVCASDEGGEAFKDVPTSLKTISNRINDFLQENDSMPEICNPVLEDESFTRHWDDEKYRHFRDMFALYTEKINEAFDATEHNDIVKKWRKLFGDKFGELKDENGNKGIAPVIVTPRKPYAR